MDKDDLDKLKNALKDLKARLQGDLEEEENRKVVKTIKIPDSLQTIIDEHSALCDKGNELKDQLDEISSKLKILKEEGLMKLEEEMPELAKEDYSIVPNKGHIEVYEKRR